MLPFLGKFAKVGNVTDRNGINNESVGDMRESGRIIHGIKTV